MRISLWSGWFRSGRNPRGRRPYVSAPTSSGAGPEPTLLPPCRTSSSVSSIRHSATRWRGTSPTNELSQASTRLTASIRAADARGDHRELDTLRTQLSKTRCRPKDVYSCILNAPTDNTWPAAICGCTTATCPLPRRTDPRRPLFALNSALRQFRHSVLLHPLNSHVTSIPIGMANLEDHAVRTAASTLRSIGVRTSVSINDSVLYERQPVSNFWHSPSPLDPQTTVAEFIHRAVTAELGYNTLSSTVQ